jgi:large subunit ribosomal protein L3
MAMVALGIGGAVGLILPPRGRRGGAVSWSLGTGRRAAAVAVRASYEAGVGVMATKVGMMTYFEPDTGKPVPVTVVGFREGNVVTQVKTAATDGYDALQVGYHGVREEKLTRPELGHLGKAGAPPLRHLQEFRLTAVDAFEPGQELHFAELFKEGDLVDVSANSIGKGFQGTVTPTLQCKLNTVSCLQCLHSVSAIQRRTKLATPEMVLAVP